MGRCTVEAGADPSSCCAALRAQPLQLRGKQLIFVHLLMAVMGLPATGRACPPPAPPLPGAWQPAKPTPGAPPRPRALRATCRFGPDSYARLLTGLSDPLRDTVEEKGSAELKWLICVRWLPMTRTKLGHGAGHLGIRTRTAGRARRR